MVLRFFVLIPTGGSDYEIIVIVIINVTEYGNVMTGLVVGIPALIFYNWLQGQVEYFVFEMEDNSTALLDMLIQKGESQDEFSDESL